jgi:hypothetical protein
MQIKLCMIRGFQRLQAEKAFMLITIAGNLLMSLVLGSVFYNLPPTTSSFFGRETLLFFAILFNALSSALEVCPPCCSTASLNKILLTPLPTWTSPRALLTLLGFTLIYSTTYC